MPNPAPRIATTGAFTIHKTHFVDIEDFLWTVIFIPFLIGLFKFRHFSEPLKWLFYFVAFGVLNELASVALLHFDITNIMVKRHIYSFVSFGLLGIFYFHLLRGFIKANWIIAAIVVYELYYLAHTLIFSNISVYPGIQRSVGTIVHMIFAVAYFYKLMIEAKVRRLSREPMVWINVSVLLYYSGNLFFYVLFNMLFEYSRAFNKLTFIYFAILNSIFYCLIAIGFWQVKPKKRQASDS